MLSRFPRRADAQLFLAVAPAAALVAGLAVAGSLAAVGRTFPGFVVWDNLVVVALGRPTWTGMQAAVPFREHVVSVDDVPVAARADLERIVQATPPRTVHRYAFDGPGGPAARAVPSAVFRWGDWTATMGVYAINGLAFLLTGLAVFYLKPESPQSRAMLAFGVIWGLTLLLAVDLFTAGRLRYLYFVLEALSPAAILHLALAFPERRLRRNGLLVALYACALAVGLAQVAAFDRARAVLLAVNDAVYLAMAAAGLAGLVSIAAGAFGAGSPLARRRARVVLAGAITAFGIPLLALLAFFLLREPVSFSLLTLTGFLFPLSIGYAVARHDLFEADRFVKLSLVYTTLTALVALAYGATALATDRLVAEFALRQSPLFPLAFVLVALATIVPLRDRVQRAVDRLFYRGAVDYKETIARASERMTTLLDRDAIVRHVVTTLRDVLFLDRVTLWEREDGALVRRVQAEPPDAPSRVPAAHPGLAALEALARPLSADEVEESPRLRPARDALRDLFATVDATLLVPFLREGRAAGLLGVGRKASGGALSADDVDVLRTLANETAVALANAAAVAQLKEAREQLARSERLAAIGELSAAVAHGIRNPLAGIRLAAQLGLESAAADDPVRENLTDVLAEVGRLEAQVRGILDFARPFEPRLEPLDLAGLLRPLLDTLAPHFEAAKVTATLQAPNGLPRVLADRAHVTQAFQELIVNALEAMAGGGRLTLSVAAAGDGVSLVRVTVADSGPGVPPAIRERIFQLFMTTKRTGTGVGLAVVRKILERHGGRISLDPGEGPGARFVVELPVA